MYLAVYLNIITTTFECFQLHHFKQLGDKVSFLTAVFLVISKVFIYSPDPCSIWIIVKNLKNEINLCRGSLWCAVGGTV